MGQVYYPLLDIQSVLPILNKIAIFGGLSEAQLYQILCRLKTTCYGEGDFVYHRGEAPSYIYIIQKGEVRIVIDEENTSLELAVLSTGDCFGETSLIGIQSHSSSAVATEKTSLIVLERSVLFSIFETDKELFGLLILNIARETARRLHHSDDALAQYLFGSDE